MLYQRLNLLLLQPILFINYIFKDVFQTTHQFKRLWECKGCMFPTKGHHKDALTILRNAVVFCVEDGIVIGVALLDEPLAPPLEVGRKFLLGECLYIFHEQELGMFGFDGTCAIPQQGGT